MKGIKVILVAVVLFIWAQSVIPPTESTEESMFVLDTIQSIIDSMGIKLELTHHFIRKAAHFTEHAVAGSLISVLLIDDKNKLVKICVPLVCGLLIGFIDETIQIFSGRGSMIQDVWLDFSGGLFGCFVTRTVYWLIHRSKLKQ